MGGSLEKEGGKGVLVMDFYVLLTIGWGFLSWGVFFLLFSFSFFSGGEVCIFVFLFLLSALFLFFPLFPFLPLLFSR